jgi:hypothetical protein
MRNLGWVISLVWLVAADSAEAACTPDQIEAFIAKGISSTVIEQACGSGGTGPNSSFPQQQTPSGRLCLTNLGTCVMVIPGLVGQACTCPSVWGPVVGTTQ